MSQFGFRPLVPEDRALTPLLERAAELVAESLRLESAAGTLAAAVAPLLRSMNSYYTNKIEGQHTRPADIARALSKQFGADSDLARKQRLAVAHIEAEARLETALPVPHSSLYESSFVQRVHAELYQRLPEVDRVTTEGTPIAPGAFRAADVAAGRHIAPPADDVPALLSAWGKAYSNLPRFEHALVGAACAHHRLLWVHPFPDGNGRTARLHSHLGLSSLGVTRGLWSPLRGMARDHEGYYARLGNADLPRRNDLDGRGALSQEELVRFAEWFLERCVDQARFMRGLLSLEQIKQHIRDLLAWLAARPWPVGSERSVIKTEALEALHYVALAGPIDRTRFIDMMGLPERTGRRVLASLLDFGVLSSDSPRGPVSFAVPFASLRFLFPRLWPEAEADALGTS